MKLIILAVTIMYFAPLWGQDPVVDASKYQLVPTVETVKAESFGSASYLEIVGKHEGWMNLAGIPPSDWSVANELISRESGWNPNAVNASSGACGLGQQLPCGKWPHEWNEPVGALKDMQEYVIGRYGTWANALSWHDSHNWY